MHSYWTPEHKFLFRDIIWFEIRDYTRDPRIPHIDANVLSICTEKSVRPCP